MRNAASTTSALHPHWADRAPTDSQCSRGTTPRAPRGSTEAIWRSRDRQEPCLPLANASPPLPPRPTTHTTRQELARWHRQAYAGGELANQRHKLSEAQLRFRKAKDICAHLCRMRQVPPPAQVRCQHVKRYCRGGDGVLGTRPDDPPVHHNT